MYTWRINEEDCILENIEDPQCSVKFYPVDALKEEKWNIYAYVYVSGKGECFVKVGMADGETVYARLSNATDTVCHFKHVIGLWSVDSSKVKGLIDYELFHKTYGKADMGNMYFEWAGPKGDKVNTKEAYRVKVKDGIKRICEIIGKGVEELNGSMRSARKSRTDYDNVIVDAALLLKYYNSGSFRYVLADLCARYGKTGLFIRHLRLCPARIMVVTSYIGTVAHSYMKEVQELKDNENILFLDPDTYKENTEKVAVKWLSKSPNNKVLYYVALTGDADRGGDGAVKRRFKPLGKLLEKYDSILLVEESDFGADCKKQVNKIRSLYNKHSRVKQVIVATGTDADNSARLICGENSFKAIRRTYLNDVSLRKNATRIKWTQFSDTRQLEDDGFSEMDCLNFTRLFTIKDDGRFVGERWLGQSIKYIFESEFFAFGENHLNPRGATIIYTPLNKEVMEKLKELIERVLGRDYKVVVLNGDTTTAREAEQKAKKVIENRDDVSKVIFISGMICNRSWSVKEVKNVVFMCNGGDRSTIVQKMSRGLTPLENNEDNWCSVIDFMLEDSSVSTPMENVIQDFGYKFFSDCESNVGEDFMKFFEKCSFVRHFVNGNKPLRKLTEEEINHIATGCASIRNSIVMNRVDFLKEVMDDVRANEYEKTHRATDMLKREDMMSALRIHADNVLGASGHQKTKKSTRFQRTTREEDEQFNRGDAKEHHIAWFMNNYGVFFSGFNADLFEDWEKRTSWNKGVCAAHDVDYNLIDDVVKGIKKIGIEL